MLRLITEGPGWTDDITFLKWENEENPGEFHLIGYNSGAGDIIAITEQSFEDAVKDLTSIHAWTNEEDGTSHYLEGDNPDNFNADYYGLDEDNLFEDSIDFDDVSDFLDYLGYNENEEDSEEDEDLLSYDQAVDYIEEQGISCDPGNYIGEYVCDLLDDYADEEGYDDGFGLGGDSKYSKSTVDWIIKRAKEKLEEYEADQASEEDD